MARISYQALFVKAQKAGARRDYPEAEALLTRIVAETDTLPEAWLYLGRARHALGDHDRAVAAFAVYLGMRPGDGSAWFFLGRTYLAFGRAREAIACLKTAIDKGRQDAETWALLGFAELRLKRSGKAVASLEKALSLAPEDQRIFRAYLNALYVHAIRLVSRGAPDEAVGMLGFVIDHGLDGPAQRLYRARAYRTLGKLREAISDLDEAISCAPDDSSLRLLAATLKFSVGDSEGAMADIQRSGASLPDRAGSPLSADAIDRWRIMVALRQGDNKTALKAALDRIRNGESDAAIRAVAAQANYELRRFDRAAAHYRRAIEADPGAPEFRLGLALSLCELADYPGARLASRSAAARGAARDDTLYVDVLCDVNTGVDPSIVLSKVQALLRSRPGDPRLMQALGECLYKTGRPDLAVAWFDKVLMVWPGHELAMLYGISAAESLGDTKIAVKRYSEYLALYPDNAAVRKEYIDLLVSVSAWRDAAMCIEEGNAFGATRGNEGLLALCLRNSGRYREAAAIYRNLLRASPKNVDLLLGLSYSLNKSGASGLAADLLERGAAFIGTSSEPYLALGVLKARLGQAEKAAQSFLKASELAPADPRPLRNLARLYAKAGVADTASHFEERAKALETLSTSPKKQKRG